MFEISSARVSDVTSILFVLINKIISGDASLNVFMSMISGMIIIIGQAFAFSP